MFRRISFKKLLILGFLGTILSIFLMSELFFSKTKSSSVIKTTPIIKDNKGDNMKEPPYDEDYGIAINKVREKVRPGKVVYSVPSEMELGKNDIVRVRISDNFKKDLKEGIKSNYKEDKLNVTTLLEVKLSGTNFNIQTQTKEKQILTKDGSAEWIWSVTPQEKGEQQIFITVYAIIQLSNRPEVNEKLQTFERPIKVSVSVDYWFENNWKWIVENWEVLTGVFTFFSVFLLATWKKIKNLINNLLKRIY